MIKIYMGIFVMFLIIGCQSSREAELVIQTTPADTRINSGESVLFDASGSEYDRIEWSLNGVVQGQCKNSDECSLTFYDEGSNQVKIVVYVDANNTLGFLTEDSSDEVTVIITVL